MPPPRKRLGEMLRLYRTVGARSLRDLAPEMGISHVTLQRIENGHTCDAETILRIWQWMLAPINTPDTPAAEEVTT